MELLHLKVLLKIKYQKFLNSHMQSAQFYSTKSSRQMEPKI